LEKSNSAFILRGRKKEVLLKRFRAKEERRWEKNDVWKAVGHNGGLTGKKLKGRGAEKQNDLETGWFARGEGVTTL